MNGFRRIMGVNVTGSYIMAKQFARAMVAQQTAASIVLIASMSGSIANRVSRPKCLRKKSQHAGGQYEMLMQFLCQGLHCSAYITSKGAVHQMCHSLAYE